MNLLKIAAHVALGFPLYSMRMTWITAICLRLVFSTIFKLKIKQYFLKEEYNILNQNNKHITEE